MSGRKNITVPFNAIPAVAANMVANIVSKITSSAYQDNIGISVKWTSANAVGVIAVECSVNYDPIKNPNGDFFALTFNPVLTQPASNNGGYLINLNQLPFPWYRVTYTATSGTGTLDVWFTSKEI